MHDGIKQEIMASFEQALDGHLLYAESIADADRLAAKAKQVVQYFRFAQHSAFGAASPDTTWDWLDGAIGDLEVELRLNGVSCEETPSHLQKYEDEHLEQWESE